MANIIPALVLAETDTETAEIMREFEVGARDLPERTAVYAKYIVPLFVSPSSSVRKNAFNSSLAILSSQPTATEQLMPAFQSAMLCPDTGISQHAISFLPQFVSLCRMHAKELINTAVRATQSRPGYNESFKYIAEAMDITKRQQNQK